MGRSTGSCLRDFFLFLVVSLICFGVAEFVLRHSPYGERFGWNRTLSVSERMSAAFASPPAGTIILGLGDSFTEFGDAEGNNFLRIAESALNDRGYNVSVVNLAQSGTGVTAYHRMLQSAASKLKPTIAVFGIYLGNDVLDFEQSLKHATALKRSGPVFSRSSDNLSSKHTDELFWFWASNSPLKRTIKRHSLLLNLLFRLGKWQFPFLRSGFYESSISYLMVAENKDEAFILERESVVDGSLLELARADMINPWDAAYGIVRPMLYVDMLTLKEESLFPEALKMFMSSLTDIHAFCRSHGIKDVYVLIPPSVQVSQKYHNYFKRLGFDVPKSLVGEQRLNQEIKRFLEQSGYLFFDVLPVLLKSEDNVYLENDIHFNSHGQALSGEALAGFLQTLLR